MNPYSILGLTPEATADDVLKAYRSASKKHHPDRPRGNREKFEAVNAAYRVLKDPELRAEFDKTGQMPGEKFDTTYADTVQIVIQCFGRAMQDTEFYSRRDIIADAKNFVQKKLSKLDEQARVALADQAKLTDSIARLTIKAGKNNPIVAHLNLMVEQVSKALHQIAQQKHLHMLALDLLNDYTWRADAMQSPTQMLGEGQGFFRISTGW